LSSISLSAYRTETEEGEAYAPLFVECSGCKCCVKILPEHHGQLVAFSSYKLQHGCNTA
jgi:hypothetical protein